MTKQKTTKKMKVVGNQQYINKETGEVENFNVIKMESRDFNFDKIWIAHILDSLEAIGNQKIKVMTELLRLKNRDNLILATQSELVKSTGVSRPIISQTIKVLIESDFLQKVRNGLYRINPDHLFKGNQKNRMSILLEYTNKNGEIEESQIDDNPDTFVQTKSPDEAR